MSIGKMMSRRTADRIYIISVYFATYTANSTVPHHHHHQFIPRSSVAITALSRTESCDADAVIVAIFGIRRRSSVSSPRL